MKRIRHVPSNSHRSRNRALSTGEPGIACSTTSQASKGVECRTADMVGALCCIEQVEDHGMSHNPLRIALMAPAQGKKASKGKEKKLLRKEVSLQPCIALLTHMAQQLDGQLELSLACPCRRTKRLLRKGHQSQTPCVEPTR
jgi:hypothetical protein